MTIRVRVSEARLIPSHYLVVMGYVSCVTEDASSAEEALSMFLTKFVSPEFDAELTDKYEIGGEVRYLYTVTLPHD